MKLLLDTHIFLWYISGGTKWLETLPAFHRDPFDRMLICQSLEHQLVIATVDGAIRNYAVTTL